MFHDKELLNYTVNFKTNSIQLSFDNNITLEFKNMFLYKFYDETIGSIILEIVEEDIENFFLDNAEYILENNNYGAPIFYATPEELKKYDYRVTELILSKKGIKSIEYSYVTNKILLYYDVKLISEKQILDWLNKVWKTMINHSELYENKSLKEIEDNLDTFYNIIKEL